ncbi:MAG: GatB/YqeY domain-containing protein [Mariprofundaceae bacterium]
MLADAILNDMKQAMKAGEKLRLGAIRMLRGSIKDKEIELGRSLSDEDIHALIGKLVKQRRDAAVQFEAGGRIESQQKELAEADVLLAYMPEQLSEDAVQQAVDEAIEQLGVSSLRDMGKVMAALGGKLKGRADMAQVSALVKTRLQG